MNNRPSRIRWSLGLTLGFVISSALPLMGEQAPGSVAASEDTEAAGPAVGSPATETSPAVPENPYRPISLRNAFALVPPPVVAPPDVAPPPPPPPPIQVKLSGLTDLLGRKMAFLVLTEQGPGKQPKSRRLAEGEKESGIEVLSIDFDSRSVKLNNNGFVTNLGFAKLEASAPVAAQIPNPGGGPRVLPNFNPAPGGPVPPPPTALNHDGGGSVIIGKQSGGGEFGGNRGGVFTSGAAPVFPSGNSGGVQTSTSYGGGSGGSLSPSYNGNSTIPAGANSLPSREPRASSGRVKNFQIPVPPAIPMPGGG